MTLEKDAQRRYTHTHTQTSKRADRIEGVCAFTIVTLIPVNNKIFYFITATAFGI